MCIIDDFGKALSALDQVSWSELAFKDAVLKMIAEGLHGLEHFSKTFVICDVVANDVGRTHTKNPLSIKEIAVHTPYASSNSTRSQATKQEKEINQIVKEQLRWTKLRVVLIRSLIPDRSILSYYLDTTRSVVQRRATIYSNKNNLLAVIWL